MLQFNNVSLEFAGTPLFENVSFVLQKGEKCALLGRNGSGKSTLLRLIAKEMETTKGTIGIPKGYRIGYLEQHIHFTSPTLREEAALGLPEGEKEHLYKAEKILFGLGFTEDDLDKSPSLFSGGYHLRLHLAKVLISNPDCLLLDEPTNYLDILSIRWLETFLKKWPREFIIISHDREFLDNVSTHTMGIHRHQVKKIKGPTVAFFEILLAEEEVYEKTRLKAEKKQAKTLEFVERFGAKATKATQAQSRLKMLAKEPVFEKLNQLANLSFHFPEAPFPGCKVLEAQAVAFSYGQTPLIHDLQFLLEKGKKMAIIGKNGRGKSTILRLLAKDLAPQSGLLTFSDNTHIGYFGQTHINRLHPSHTIIEELSSANPDLNITELKGIAGKMLFSGTSSEKKIGVLSGGEKSRVLLGKILAKPCNLLLLDEPTHHLDIESVEALITALEEFEGAVILVTHSELILRRLSLDQLLICEEKAQKLFLGNYDLFLERWGWEEEKKNAPPPKQTPKPKNPSLRPFERKIQECEEAIMKLEEEQKKALELAVDNPTFFQEIGIRQGKIDALYLELEAHHLTYQKKKNEQ